MSTPRFWVYLENNVQGPVDIPALRKLNGFNLLTQVCQEGQSAWRMADEVIEIKSYFSAPPRVSALITQQNAQTAEIPETLPSPKTIELSVVDAQASADTDTLPDASNTPNTDAVMQKLEADSPLAKRPALVPPEGEEETLGKMCPKCAKQNPLERKTCRACGVALEPDKEDMPVSTLESLTKPLDEPMPATNSAATQDPDSAAMPTTPMVEIPMRRLAIIIGSMAIVGIVVLFGHKGWKKHQAKKAAAAAPALTLAHSTPSAPRQTKTTHAKRHAPQNTHRASAHTATVYRAHPKAASMPGVTPAATPKRAQKAASVPALKSIYHEDTNTAPMTTGAGSYDIVTEAAPQRRRESSPIDSPYAKKRRGQKELWESRGEEAIYLAQHQRIYGGRRTVLRNTEILFQVLRDREYTSAFESGRRLYLYNDMDWGATQIEGPLYEVQLTFSGGKELDGTSRKPLKFSFEADLERKTVQAGGTEAIQSNTMHGFFDESRIAPDDRTAVAKDTEELVLAAQPESSPLALQTVVRQFVRTYSEAKAKQIGAAYGLDSISKILVREQPAAKPTPDEVSSSSLTGEKSRPTITKADIAPRTAISKGRIGPVEFSLENGSGKERLITAKVRSRATVARLWETVTGYDRFSQYIPDILTSQKEGQDGQATVVQTVSLARFMFFVFKVTLHLHLIEHPYDHSIEFERIAGDFNSFRGTLSVTSDPANPAIGVVSLNAKLVPKGFVPEWILRGMSQRFISSVMDALRAKAES